MDRKSVLILLVSFVLLFLYFTMIPKWFPPIPVPRSTNIMVGPTNRLAPTNGTPGSPSLMASGTNQPSPTPEPGASEHIERLETDNVIYTFTSQGGGLKFVELKKYREAVGCGNKRPADTNEMATLHTATRLPVLAVIGGDALTGNNIFQLTKTSSTSLRAETRLPNGLLVTKNFQIGSNYLVEAQVQLRNESPQAISLPPQTWLAGAATPMDPRDNGQLMGIYWYNGAKAEHVQSGWFDNKTLGCSMGSVPRSEYVSGSGNVYWVAAHNQFFTLAVITPTNAPAAQIVAHRIDLPPPTRAEINADPKRVQRPFGFEASLVYPAITLSPTQTVERAFTIYAGPKEYKTLSQFRNKLDHVMEFNGFFGWFAKLLLLSMNGLHALGLPYWLTIVSITVIIKTLFWPLTQASTKSMKRLQALQPEMKALQEKYKADPAKMNKKLMEFMKENKVSPLGGCLPMVLQIPVFFGFFKMIQSAIELRGARFFWACDLSKPDTVAHIPGFDFPINPLPLLMGATMLWQARLTPASPGMDPAQQKIMKYMPMIFMVFLYNFSAGLTLYWTVQNLLTIAQMKLTSAKTAPPTPTVPSPVTVKPAKKK